MGSHGDPGKWHMPGWRIEQRFAPGVLIGNWAEEQHQFLKGNYKHNSTNRIDFQNYGSFRPDVIIRRKAQLQSDGLGAERLFYHHGNKYSNNMISWYDEQYNKRQREEKDKLPETRHWDGNSLSWVPEKSDYPIQGAPTNYGLHQKLQERWSAQIANETFGDYNTTYKADFLQTDKEDMVKTRYAFPRGKSTSLHKANTINKDLRLRDKCVLQSPEMLPSLVNPAGPVLLTTQ